MSDSDGPISSGRGRRRRWVFWSRVEGRRDRESSGPREVWGGKEIWTKWPDECALRQSRGRAGTRPQEQDGRWALFKIFSPSGTESMTSGWVATQLLAVGEHFHCLGGQNRQHWEEW